MFLGKCVRIIEISYMFIEYSYIKDVCAGTNSLGVALCHLYELTIILMCNDIYTLFICCGGFCSDIKKFIKHGNMRILIYAFLLCLRFRR